MIIVLRKKHLLISLSVCVAFGAICALYANLFPKTVSASAPANTNWGLGFKEEGKAPSGNASIEFLKKYNSYYLDARADNTIYITFDAGYENGYTESILDTLKKHNVKATFFVVGNYIESSPDIVKRMVDEGHVVGNHTMTHPDMSKIADIESFKKEILGLEERYKNVTGQEMKKYYRPPQGKYCEENLKQASSLGYKTIFWSLAYVDWYVDKQPSKEEAFNKLVPRIHPGAIVLLHSTSKTNCDILDELLTKWESMGYSFGDIETLE